MQPGYYPEYQQPEPASIVDQILALNGLWFVVALALFIAVCVLGFVALARQFLYICRPNEALIFSGQSYKQADGTTVGYRVIQSGLRAFRIPVLERVDRMDMRLIPIDIHVQNAYSSGNIPLNVHAIANVKVASDPASLPNAIERFLGRTQHELQVVAQQTLEGVLREVLAQLTPEDVNTNRLKFAEKLIGSAEDDLAKLGLSLDTLKIQNVSDDTGYLDSLGRPRIAGAKRDAENAENEAGRQITQAQALAHQAAEVARAQAEGTILQKRNELRRVQAELEGEAAAIEKEAEAAAKTARAEAEKELQALRSDLEQKRLQAEVVIPADVNRQAAQIRAVGEAAPTVENGVAQVEVLRLMSEAWRSMGADAKEIYVIQHLEEIVGTVVQSLSNVTIDEVNVLDQGDGHGLSSYAATYPQMVAAVLRALRESTGVDVPAILAPKNGEVRA